MKLSIVRRNGVKLDVKRIEIPENATVEELQNAKEVAQRVLYAKYLKVLTSITHAENTLDDIPFGSHEFDLMTEEDYNDTFGMGTIDAVEMLKRHLEEQIYKVELYINDLTAAIKNLIEE